MILLEKGGSMTSGWLKRQAESTQEEVTNWSSSMKKSAQIDNVEFISASAKRVTRKIIKRKKAA